MLARILAAFALFTGLASVGAPASAELFAAYSQPSERAPQGAQEAPQTPCTAARPKAGAGNRADADNGCRVRKPIIIYMPAVQLGIDLALE